MDLQEAKYILERCAIKKAKIEEAVKVVAEAEGSSEGSSEGSDKSTDDDQNDDELVVE